MGSLENRTNLTLIGQQVRLDNGVVVIVREAPEAKATIGLSDGVIPTVHLPSGDTACLDVPSSQFGTKWGKHAGDYGFDPSDPIGRQWYDSRINEVFLSPDEIRHGPYRVNGGGGPDYLFFKQGSDLLIMKPTGEFVTMLPYTTAHSWWETAQVIPL